jgi:beta-glucosidase-like glycosyl hydrolase/CubicO group peptidase (beta-lactamase class C family)
MRKCLFLFFCLVLIPSINLFSKEILPEQIVNHWVDSVFNSLSIEERIAQCLMPAIYPRDTAQYRSMLAQVKQYKPGGIILFQGGPKQTVNLINQAQDNSKTPLLVGIDGEWGLSMRMDSVISFPRQLALGAISDDTLIYEMGTDIAHQLKRLGIHTNFAPVVDINSNPNNPVISSRSFGEEREMVAQKAYFYMKALQDNGILAVAKHFPGHGDTESDSHLTLPKISHSFQRIDTFELYPFKKLIQSGIQGIMVAHINVPSIDSSNVPASISPKVVDSLLIKVLGFKGLIFTDALNMKGVQNGSAKEIIIKAFIAKNDILLMPANLKDAIDTIRNALNKGIITQEDLNNRCKKILMAKYSLGLNNRKVVDTTNLLADLNRHEYMLTRIKIIESSLTLLSNKNNIIPLERLDTLKIAIVSVGDTFPNRDFNNTASLYTEASFFSLSKMSTDSDFYEVYSKLHEYNLIIALLDNTDMRPARKFGVTEKEINYLELLSFNFPTLLCIFGSPYILNSFSQLTNFAAILEAYEDNSTVHDIAAQIIFGGIPVKGHLPVTCSKDFKIKDGISLPKSIRVKYTIPEELGINSNILTSAIDSIVNSAINKKAMPGCVVYLAKDNKVFFYKSYGYFTYDSVQPVQNNNIYDLASVTKISATTPAIMKLYEEGKINLNAPLIKYLPVLKKSNKGELIISDILTHQAQLQPVVDIYSHVLYCDNKKSHEIYSNIVKKGNGSEKIIDCTTKWKPFIFQSTFSSEYPLQVADSLYVQASWRDSILYFISSSPLLKKKEYKYSDLGFILLQKSVENIVDQPIDQWVQNNLYRSLGAKTLTYLPLQRYSRHMIAPTEKDTIFRKRIIQGTVHDPVAAMMGGVAGHAGLFSNANDLGKLMHVYLNYGSYGNQKYFDSATVKLFTSAPFISSGNRRALGFDKPQFDLSQPSPVSRYCSLSSYGHTGFTGTMAWVDPEYQLVFVFLSNRTFPYSNHNKLAELNVRTAIQDVIYKLILKSGKSKVNNIHAHNY